MNKANAENTIHIDIKLIPEHVQNQLAVAAMDMVLGIIRRPGGRELLDARKAEIARRNAHVVP